MFQNSVRHNLSLHGRFKRVKRNGMDKPSWWTVDVNEEAKRYRTGGSHRQKQHHDRATSGGKLKPVKMRQRASTGDFSGLTRVTAMGLGTSEWYVKR